MTDERPRMRIDWLKAIAGALAAASSAVLLSTLGAGGTLAGAAIGSVVVTVTSALYTQGLDRSRRRMADAQSAARRRVGLAQAEVRRATRDSDEKAVDAHLQYADHQLVEARIDLDSAEEDPPTWWDRVVALRWKRITVVAAAFCAAALILITAFELIAGEPVSSYTGGTTGHGTSWSRVGRGAGPSRPAPAPSTTPTPTPTPSPTPSPSASTTPSPTATAPPPPTPSATSSPTASPISPTTSTSPIP